MSQINFELICDSRFLDDFGEKEVKHTLSKERKKFVYLYNGNEYIKYTDLPKSKQIEIDNKMINSISKRIETLKEKLGKLFNGTSTEFNANYIKKISFSDGGDVQHRAQCRIYKPNGKQKYTLNDIYGTVNSTGNAVHFKTL